MNRLHAALPWILGVLSAALITVTAMQGCEAKYKETSSAGKHWQFVCAGSFDFKGGTDYYSITLRMPVKGGWLYRVSTGKNNTLEFVPDGEVKLVLPPAEAE